MTVPAEAVLRVLWGLAVGAMLGLWYDFLRPLRRRHNAPADICFVLVVLMGWVWYSFQVCGGDIRFGGTASLGMGMLLWLGTVSMAARKVFRWFWLAIFRIFSVLTLPLVKIFKKIAVFSKKVFAYGKKRGYNRKSNRKPHRDPEEPAMNKQTKASTQQAANGREESKTYKVWVKLAVLLVIIVSTVCLLTAYAVISHIKETNRNLQQQALELEEGNKDLQHYIDNKDTDEGVKDVAKDELGMVDPDTVIYEFD